MFPVDEVAAADWSLTAGDKFSAATEFLFVYSDTETLQLVETGHQQRDCECHCVFFILCVNSHCDSVFVEFFTPAGVTVAFVSM